MQHSGYVPLHLHTEYSLLDGAIKIKDLVDTAVKFKLPAVAVTDHGSMFGAVDFYFKAVNAGIKPILGCEVYVAPNGIAEKDDKPYHLILLARDNDGYKNLITLVSKSYLEGFHRRPRIDKDMLEQYSGGLIGLSACLQGEVPRKVLSGDLDAAREAALWYKHVLGPENFYFELQDNGLDEQRKVNEALKQLSQELHVGLVATNDCHYLRADDKKAHEVLLCIQTGRTMSDPARFRFNGEGYYFRSPEEMIAAFKDTPEAIANTRAIAERCNVVFQQGKFHFPLVKNTDGKTPEQRIEKLARAGMSKRFGDDIPKDYQDRFDLELSVIKKMGYSSYFLIVGDFIHFAKTNNIPVGPGRGSAAGSLVAYALEITELDPIRYGLLFERFLNPERISMPDIDVDFCRDKRGEVIRYVTETYGKDHVAQIITFGTMAAKAAIRDVARALDFPYADADRIAKLVPDTLKITIDDAIKQEPQLKALYQKDGAVKELLDIARRVEGLSRHASTHAAGVVISPEPLTNHVPLYKAPNEDAIVTQFEMNSLDKIGLIKFDFLGLKTLTVIEKCVELIHTSGIDFSMNNLPLDDGQTYKFLGTGQTTGVFQLESDGMKDILIKMQPNRFEDIIALVALYRPGPIGSGMIDTFINRKKGKEKIEYDLPELKEILDETYGVILYQEQVMRIANKLASFSMGQADVLRKAMGKKKADVMAQMREQFVSGAVKNKIDQGKALRLFELMEHFAEYGFNKSHSAAYALVSYQTAYLKAHYPMHFMAATLSMDLDNSDKIVKSIKECRNMDIQILPPDVNLCGREFTVDGSAIRFGLGAVKGVGAAAVDVILEARASGGRFASLEDYLLRVDPKRVNKRVNEALSKAGAFDSLFITDSTMASIARARYEALQRLNTSQGGGVPSLSLFGELEESEPEQDKAWDEAELLSNEKAALGFYISGNPLNKFSRLLSAMNISTVFELKEAADGQEVEAAGIVMNIKRVRTKKGDIMAALTIEDESASAEVIVFPDMYREKSGMLEKDMPIIVRGTLENSDKGLKIVAKELLRIEELLQGSDGERRAVISVTEGTDLRALKEMVGEFSGSVPLFLRIRTGGSETLIQTSCGVTPDSALVESVEGFCGKGALKVV